MSDFNSIGKESLFNEAALRIQRIHQSQSIINALRVNMLQYNLDYGKRNYEIIVTELISIGKEISGKMSPDEKGKYHRWRDVIFSLMDLLPVFSTTYAYSQNRKKKEMLIDNKNWGILRKLITEFEDFITETTERTGYSGANKDDVTRAVIQS